MPDQIIVIQDAELVQATVTVTPGTPVQVTLEVDTVTLPQGGLLGQVLSKVSDEDYHYTWADGINTPLSRQFDTVADMTASLLPWLQAFCLNYYPDDHYLTYWVKLVDSGRVANGSSLLDCADGNILWKITLEEYLGSTVVISPTITPYSVAGLTIFPSLADARNSYATTAKVEFLPQVDGNGGGDLNNESANFVRGGTPTGIDGMDYFYTAGGILYTRYTTT
jgi:hypothetical protein